MRPYTFEPERGSDDDSDDEDSSDSDLDNDRVGNTEWYASLKSYIFPNVEKEKSLTHP